ncbi:MAG: type II secretion system F family protein, partial [Deltaproteobacteria bacterium]
AKRSPFIDELEVVLNEIKLGTTRADALRNMATRINMPEISSLVAVLVTAEQMGSSISAALKSQADQIRNDRFIRAEKAGAAASQKILFPLIFFIVPAVFIVVLGPLIAKLLQKLFSGEIGGIGGGFF